MISTLLIVLLVFLLLLSGFFSASETALFSLSPLKVNLYAQDEQRSKQLVAKLLSRPRELLMTILMVNIGVNIGVQNVISSIFGIYSSWLLTVGVPLLLTLLFGEAIPKSIAISHNAKIAPFVAPIIYTIRALIKPIQTVVMGISSFVSRILFFYLKKDKEISLEELKHVLQTSKEKGIISSDEAMLLKGSLKIDELLVKELMQPRQEVLYFDIEQDLSKLILLFVEEEVSRVPVIDKEFDNVIGIMTSDICFIYRNEIKTSQDLRKFLKDPLFVPETISAREMLALFQDTKESIALVVDEYGQISGLIAAEDIVEVVIGQIADKRDEKALYTAQGEDVLICSGKLEITQLEEIFGITLDETSSAVTVGGYLIEVLGDIPKSGTKFSTDALFFHVLASTPSRVTRIYVRKIEPRQKKGGS